MKLKYLLLLALLLTAASVYPSALYRDQQDQAYRESIDSKTELRRPEKKEPEKKKQVAVEPKANESHSTPLPAPKIISVASPVLKLINQARANSGLSMVAESASLTASAQGQSNWMASGGGLNHRGYPYEIIGYNMGYSNPQVQVVNAWIASPPHNHIMFGNFSQGGCSEVVSGSYHWFTCWFK